MSDKIFDLKTVLYDELKETIIEGCDEIDMYSLFDDSLNDDCLHELPFGLSYSYLMKTYDPNQYDVCYSDYVESVDDQYTEIEGCWYANDEIVDMIEVFKDTTTDIIDGFFNL